MQISNFLIGNWEAQARVHQVGPGTLMAVISATNASGSYGNTRHTIVFDAENSAGCVDETTRVLRQVLQHRYGL